jgi:putative copper export protein
VLSVLSPATGWLLYAALALVLGSVAARWIVLPGLGDDAMTATWLRDAAIRVGRAGALLLPVAMVLVFARQLVEFHDPFATWSEDARLLLRGTAWGTTWTYGAIGAVLAVPVFVRGARGGGAAWVLTATLALAMGVFPGLTGHANAGALRPLTLAGDALHVWAAGAWVGGLAFVLYAERGWRRRPDADPESLLPLLVPAFSPLAMTCVAVLVATGTMAAWVRLPTVGALVSTPYGRRLLVKLALVATVAVLGFVNWKKLTPRLGEAEGRRALRRAAAWELMVAQVVLLVTAILVRTAPPTR